MSQLKFFNARHLKLNVLDDLSGLFHLNQHRVFAKESKQIMQLFSLCILFLSEYISVEFWHWVNAILSKSHVRLMLVRLT